MRSVAVLLALAASGFAYQVSEPAAATGWTTAGPNEVAWSKVSTDAANFTVILSNQVVSPPTSQVLAALVDGSLSKITVNPPSGGWKAGTGFRVNFVQDQEHTSTIYAQSDTFTIVQSNTTSTFSTTGSSTQLVIPTSATAGNPAGTSGTPDSANPAAPSDTSTTPDNNGALSASAHTGLFAGLALLGAFLA